MAAAVAAKAINFFDIENSYSKGQGIFPDGPCRIESARFGTFDFGQPGNDAVCMILQGQPLNSDGSDNGDPRVQYYPVGNGIELLSPVPKEKGLYSQIGIAADSEYDKLFGLSDFAIFMEHLKKANYDMDGAENDITVLDGMLCEVGKFTKPEYKAKTVKDTGKGIEKPDRGPRQVVVVTELLDAASFGKNGKGKATGPTKKVEPIAKGKAAAKEVGDDPEEIIMAYCEAELTDERLNEPALNFKIGVAEFAKKKLGKDADIARAAQAVFKDSFAAVLASRGWETKGNKLVKSE